MSAPFSSNSSVGNPTGLGSTTTRRQPLLLPIKAIVLSASITAFFAVADFLAPGDINVAIFYCLSVIASGWSRSRAFLWFTTGTCALLAIAGLAIGHQPPAPFLGAMYINRSFVAFGLLVMGLILYQRMRLLDRIEEARDFQIRQNEALEHRVQREVSNRLAAEQSLYQAQKMEAIGQMAGGIAHDFGNVLAVVIGNLDRLVSQLSKNDPRRRLAELALQGGEHGAQITKRLLSFARPQNLEPELTDISRVLSEVVALARQVVADTVELEQQPAADLWHCCVDQAQLQAALLNLIINARDAMPTRGRVVIAAQNSSIGDQFADMTPGDYVCLSVADTGMGMSPEIQARVLEPFFTTKSDGKGSGLGLSIVYGFARQSGGTLRINSALGEGTTVHLYLPRVITSDDPKP